MSTEIKNYIQEHKKVLELFHEKCSKSLKKSIEMIINSLLNGNKLLIAGNGGSAADAEHFSAELIGSYLERKRKPLACISLSSNTSTLTAVSNDYSFNKVFSRQIEALSNSSDCLILISTSGKSENILEAYKTGINLNLNIVVLTSVKHELPYYKNSSIIAIPSSNTPIIQELHILAIHIICNSIDKKFFLSQ